MIILFLQTLHCRILTLQVTHDYPGRGVWRDLNMPEYNLWSNCIEKQISGLIRHCTQILVIFLMFDTRCQHFIANIPQSLQKLTYKITDVSAYLWINLLCSQSVISLFMIVLSLTHPVSFMIQRIHENKYHYKIWFFKFKTK